MPDGGALAPGLLHRLPEPPRRVALLRASRLGDFICAIPAFRALRAALPGARVTLITVPLLRGFAERLPHFDEIWNAQHLFQQAHAYFRVIGAPLTVRMRQRPRIMHWTYPVPVHMPRTRNIYTVHDLVPLRLPFTTLTSPRVETKSLRMTRNQYMPCACAGK